MTPAGRHAPGYEWGVFRQPMNNVVPSSGEAGRRRTEQRITDPFPPSGRPLTCDDARSANGLLRASAQVAGS
jgi:hypothetical protein